jgi:HEPN domain-containing protein
MPKNDRVIAVVREWLEKADNDLRNAVHTLTLGAEGPTDTVCFHAQQCAEKYLKAFLVFIEIDFPKTHDIEELINLIPDRYRPELSIQDQRRLTAYATVTRYPGGYAPIKLSEARQAVRLARRIRKAIRGHLPKEVFQKGGK